MSERQTRDVVDRLYEKFFAGDLEGMLALMSDDVEVRFLGQAHVYGNDEARRFFEFSGGLLSDLEFRINRKIIDGEWAAVLWEETATTAEGASWDNHGVDMIHVVDGEIVVVHENNDVRKVHEHLPRYEA